MERQITCRSFFGFVFTAFLIFAVNSSHSNCHAQSSRQTINSRQIKFFHARPAKQQRAVSTVSRAARGQLLTEQPPEPLDGSLVRQVSFVDGCDTYFPEQSCGCDAPVCGCGAESIGCGCDPSIGCSCGVEVASCGIEIGPGCGIEGCASCVAGRCETPACGVEFCDGGCDACYPSGGCPLFNGVRWRRFEFFAGSQGFKGPLNFATTDLQNPDDTRGSGSFGFFQGFNVGRSHPRFLGGGLSTQFGLRATQSNLSGTDFSEETRHQVFVTGGIFRPVDYGFQFGAVLDYLNEDWYYQADLLQIRGEFSWVANNRITYGFQYMAGLEDDSSGTNVVDASGSIVESTIEFEATDQYRFFFRRRLQSAGSFTGFAGWTDNDDGILGALVDVSLGRRLMLNTGMTYLIPQEGSSTVGNQEESWNLSFGLTFRPAGFGSGYRYNRPLFNVADNGTFLIDRR